MKTPMIGITCRMLIEDGTPKYFINQSYIDYFSQFNLLPIPLVPQNEQTLYELLDMVAGVCITGGEDVSPTYYHEEPHPTCGCADFSIDTLDMQIIHYCHKKQIPLFGICRGLQVINVAFGGSLYQDIPTQLPNALGHARKHPNDTVPMHTLITKQNSIIQSLVGTNYQVNSYHHQSIKQLGEGLTITAQTADGVVECIEGHNILAVQWHPERMQDTESTAILQYWLQQCTN